MSHEPVLTKHPPDPKRDYKPMTWDRFLLLRAWANYVAWHERCTVALVGSVLEKSVPRDIDIALIWPTEEFAAIFKDVGYDQWGGSGLWENRSYQDKRTSLWISANQAVHFETRIDVRLCPDCWWPDKDRLILAVPTDMEPPNHWGDVEFTINKVVRKGDPEWEEGAP